MRNNPIIHPVWLVVLAMLFLAACSGEVNGQPEPRSASSGTIEAGRRLIAAYGCGSCHTIPGVPGADGKVGPPLDHFYKRSFIAGRVPNTDADLIQWIVDPQKVDPGVDMPTLGVSVDEAEAIAAYLYHQPTLRDYLNR